MPSSQRTARAEAAFTIYAGLGQDRSLEAVRATQTMLGQTPLGMSTLKAYSVDFDWQTRAAAFDRQVRAAHEASDDQVNQVVAMNLRQARTGEIAQTLAVQGLAQYRNQPDLLRDQGVNALGGLMERGAKLERLARGAATDRPEVVGDVMRNMIVSMIDLFNTVNDLDDRAERAQKFATEADAIVDAQVERLALPVPVPDEMPA